MPTLLLLNGPPASGKSTLARQLVAGRRLALALDIDVLRGQLSGWLDDPEAAGNAADATHHDAAMLVDRSASDDPVGEMYDALQALVEHRPDALRVATVRGDVDLTRRRLIDALRTTGTPW